MATDVGDVKSEIVFHGDTLNTAARIQGLCNELGESLLVSGELAGRLETAAGFALTKCGEHKLRGKEQATEVFAVKHS